MSSIELSGKDEGRAAFWEAALRRLAPRNVWDRVLCEPPVRKLVEDLPGKISQKEIRANFHVLLAALETFPDRVPSAFVLQKGLLMANDYFSKNMFQSADPEEEALRIAYSIKLLIGALRRLFRRSSKSRCPYEFRRSIISLRFIIASLLMLVVMYI